jgi:hypothetical protein
VGGSSQRDVKSRVEFIEGHPAVREVLTKGRGSRGDDGQPEGGAGISY